jgi:hypothetical protein
VKLIHISNKIKMLVNYLAIYGFSVVIFICTLELCARIDDAVKYGAPFFGTYTNERLRNRDDDGLPFNIPNSRYEKWKNNSYGFRGPDFPINKPHGTFRIVCLGTSETYGMFESPDNEWPAQLQKIKVGSKYQVINASVVGLSLAQIDSYIFKYVKPLKPDMIILVINPISYVTTKLRSSNYNYTVKSSKGGEAIHSYNFIDYFRIFPKTKELIKQSLTYNFPFFMKSYLLENTKYQINQAETIRLKGVKPINSVPEFIIKSYKYDLNKLIININKYNADVVITSYPSLMDRDNLEKYPDIFLDNRKFAVELSLFGMVDVFDKLNKINQAVASMHRIDYVDLASVLPKSTKYFADNVHYTDDGAKVVAECISKAVAR